MSDKTPQALATEALEAAKKIANDASDHHNVVDLNLTYDLAVAIPHFIDQALAALKSMEGPSLSMKYNELVFAVATKYEGETRHETALRYIREREENHERETGAKAAKP